MNARSLAQAQPVSRAASTAIDVEVRLELLSARDNPLSGECTLSTTGLTNAEEELEPGITVHTTKLVSVTSPWTPTLSLVLESDGHRVFALHLEVTELDEDDALEVQVTSRGLLQESAACLGIATGTYAWRMSCQASYSNDRLQLVLGLVQEIGPVTADGAVATLGSIRLPFDAPEGDEPQVARMKIKPSGTGLKVTTA